MNKRGTKPRPPIDRFLESFAVEENGCWKWTKAINNCGYGSFSISHSKSELAHRASYKLHIGEIPAGMLVCHKCDNPPCVNPAHLFLGTAKDNAIDRDSKNRGNGKYNRSCWKLTEKDVLDIKQMLSTHTNKELSAKYNISSSMVSKIRHGVKWKGLT